VDGESHIAAAEIDLDHPVDRFAEDGELVERGFEEQLLQDSINRRDQNDEPGMQRLRRVTTSKASGWLIGLADKALPQWPRAVRKSQLLRPSARPAASI
jgi:hypothetical protein